MKALIPLFMTAALFCSTQLTAQQPAPVDTTGDIEFHEVQVQASFPGGDAAWRKFLEKNLRADVPVRKKAPVGIYDVILSFLVLKDGTVKEVKIIQDPGYGTAEEALRVFKKAPKWRTAMQDGKPVIYRQKQHIVFQVAED